MPLTLANPLPPSRVLPLRERRLRRGSIRDRGRRIRVALVNNMPDSAVAATERQFARLLDEASVGYEVQLSLFSLESLPREAEAKHSLAQTYRPSRELRADAPDAVIVTGAEPRAPHLRDEPYWLELAALIDWAETRPVSALFSCLAAHAAALHRDDIVRRRLPVKQSGVFACEIVAAHELVEGLGHGIVTPHSRHNSLDEADLAAKGYDVLTRSPSAGVDIFVKETNALQVFLQGHPEYDGDTLAREFRRDMMRYLNGLAASRPAPPQNYFPAALMARLEDWTAKAASDPSAAFPLDALEMTKPAWRADGVRLFQNWLAAVARRKSAALAPTFATARCGG